jgi:hypothetical protein
MANSGCDWPGCQIPGCEAFQDVLEPVNSLPDRPYYVLPNGTQVKDVVAHLSYNIGVAAAYLFRAGRKPGNDIKDDLRKAIDHLNFELERLGG